MSGPLLLLAAQSGFGPTGATVADNIFVYGVLALLIGLVWWNGRDTPSPPKG